jgi:CheY-like chemotaxis protein
MAKVLIIEDSPVQALALQRMLELRGLNVRYAPDGQAGIDAARQWSPDAIVLDVKVPHMNGFEVCRRLQADAQTSHIPIIMLTIHNNSLALRQSICLGAIDFIPKGDFANAALLETLRQLHILSEPPHFPRTGSLEDEDAFTGQK